MITASGTENVLGLKRANWPGIASGANTTGVRQKGGAGGSGRRGGKLEANVRMRVPEELGLAGDVKVDVLVMSDAYPGMEWRVVGVVVPQVVRQEEEVKTVTVAVDEGLIKGKGKGQ